MISTNKKLRFDVIDEILAADDMIRYIGIIDSDGNVISNKSKNEEIKPAQEMFRTDLHIMKNVLDVSDSSFGKTISTQILRERSYQLTYYHDDIIIYISCDPDVDSQKMLEISEKIGQLVKKLVENTSGVCKHD